MKFIMYSLSQHEEIECRANDNEDHQCEYEILLDTAGLDDAHSFTRAVRDLCRAVAKEAIDHGQVEFIADEGTKRVSYRTKAVQYAIDDALVDKLVDHILCEPVGRFDKDTIIEFVEVILVLEQWDLEPIFRRQIDIAIDDPASI